MPKCPNCGREIDYLINSTLERVDYRYNGDEYERIDSSIEEDLGYFCPECYAQICHSELEAIDFLESSNDQVNEVSNWFD